MTSVLKAALHSDPRLNKELQSPGNAKRKISLLTSSLFSLAESVTRAVYGCLLYAGFFLTLCLWGRLKTLAAGQLHKSATAKSNSLECFRSLFSSAKSLPIKNEIEGEPPSSNLTPTSTPVKAASVSPAQQEPNLSSTFSSAYPTPTSHSSPSSATPILQTPSTPITPVPSLPESSSALPDDNSFSAEDRKQITEMEQQLAYAQQQANAQVDNKQFKYRPLPFGLSSQTTAQEIECALKTLISDARSMPVKDREKKFRGPVWQIIEDLIPLQTEQEQEKIREVLQNLKPPIAEKLLAFAYGLKVEQVTVSCYETGLCSLADKNNLEDSSIAVEFNIYIQGKVYPVCIFGVFDDDGPEGITIEKETSSAMYVRRNIVDMLKKSLEEFNANGLTDLSVKKALEATYDHLHTGLGKLTVPGLTRTSATVVLTLDNKLWTASVGNSRAILESSIQLSEDPSLRNRRYITLVQKNGGVIKNGLINNKVKAATALGDHRTKGLTHKPTITLFPMSKVEKDSHLIIGCHSVFERASTKQVAKIVKDHKEMTPSDLASSIVYAAMNAANDNNGENYTALVVKF
jgi:serine/threonine protein phosphatase PrpC